MSLNRTLVIDQLDLVVPVGETMYSKLWQMLAAWKSSDAVKLPAGNLVLLKKLYSVELKYFPTKTWRTPSAIMIAGSSMDKHRYFKLSIFPQKFTEAEFIRFQQDFCLMMHPFTYAELFKSAKVSRIDLARDSFSHKVHSFIPWKARIRHSAVWLTKFWTKGSLYIGSHTSRIQFCIYDKKRQLLEKEFMDSRWPTWTRIEARVRNPGSTASELLKKLINPFKDFHVASGSLASLPEDDEAWVAFLKLCLAVGAAEALSQETTPKIRKAYRAKLKARSVQWWNPQVFWTEFEDALLRVRPSPIAGPVS